eukprot:scaffold8080_cov417-Prasinococcus_capsulatus_cf.AAC.4
MYQIQGSDCGFVIAPSEQVLHKVSQWASMRSHERNNIFAGLVNREEDEANEIKGYKTSGGRWEDAKKKGLPYRQGNTTRDLLMPIAESLFATGKLFSSVGQEAGEAHPGYSVHVDGPAEEIVAARKALIYAESVIQTAKARVDAMLSHGSLDPDQRESIPSSAESTRVESDASLDSMGGFGDQVTATPLQHHVVIVGDAERTRKLARLLHRSSPEQVIVLVDTSREGSLGGDVEGDESPADIFMEYTNLYYISYSGAECLASLARVDLASRVVLLSSSPASFGAAGGNQGSEGQLRDVLALRHASIVSRLQGMVWANLSTDRERDFKLLVELKSDSNVRLLDALRGLSNHSYLFRSTEKSDHLPLFLERPFAAGEVLLDTAMDTLLCSAFYCADCMSVVNLLAAGAPFAAMRKHGDGTRVSKGRAYVQVILMPPSCAGKTYAELYHMLLESHNQIALGLHR